MIYAYTRVSTKGQFLENQEYGIKEFCKQRGMQVDVWVEEKVTGTKKAEDRKLGDLLRNCQKGDTIITTEISRIGRSVVDVLGVMNTLKQKEVVLIAIKQNFVLDDSLSALMISTIFSLMAQVEKEILSQRVKEGLAARKAAGMKLGRPFGSKNKQNKLFKQKDYIETLLKGGASRYLIKKQLHAHSHTLNNFLLESGLAEKYNIQLTDNFIQNKARLANK